MTALTDGRYRCDGCGGDAGNGGVIDALVCSDLNFATGMVVNLHFCRAGINGTSCAANRLAGVTAASYPHNSTDAAAAHAAAAEQARAARDGAAAGATTVADGVVLTPEQSAEHEKKATRRRPRKAAKKSTPRKDGK